MRKLQEVLWNMKKDSKEKKNKGFSLVELIIVIAIMAILVGIVGTQVIPYLQRSRESKDLQLLNSYSTAAVTAYSSNVESISATSGTIDVLVYKDATLSSTNKVSSASTDAEIIADAVLELVGYYDLGDLTDKMSSNKADDIKEVYIEIDLDSQTITTTAVNAQATTGTDVGLGSVTADI